MSAGGGCTSRLTLRGRGASSRQPTAFWCSATGCGLGSRRQAGPRPRRAGPPFWSGPREGTPRLWALAPSRDVVTDLLGKGSASARREEPVCVAADESGITADVSHPVGPNRRVTIDLSGWVRLPHSRTGRGGPAAHLQGRPDVQRADRGKATSPPRGVARLVVGSGESGGLGARGRHPPGDRPDRSCISRR